MPSHTIASALIKLWFEGETPWHFAEWKKHTGIKHGLFPEKDEHLPPQWTRSMAKDISTFFNRYNAQANEDSKIKFAAASSGEIVPGRLEWRRWVSANLAKWKLQGAIVKCLKDANIHPFSLVELDLVDNWPPANLYIPKALDAIACALFGPESLNEAGLVGPKLRAPTQHIVQHVWNALRRQFRRSRSSLPALEAKAVLALSTLEVGATKSKVTIAMRAISNFRDAADLIGSQSQREVADEMTGKIHSIMDSLGASVPADKAKKGLSKSLQTMLSKLASEDDILDLVRIYQESYCSEEDTEFSFDLGDLLEAPIVDVLDGLDTGVVLESKLSTQQLAKSLGLKGGLPVQFNRFRHNTHLTPWEQPGEFGTHPSSELTPMSLHWHQLAGLHSTIRHIFSEVSRPEHCTGMFVADEVGLGKTAQTLATIAFLNDVIWSSETKPGKLPPIIERFPYLRDKNKSIQSLPHLIVAPGTLLAQWEHEIKTLFKPKSVDILIYGSGMAAHALFWSENGPYHKSLHRPHQRIILAGHTALQQDFSKCFHGKSVGGRQGLPWELPPRKSVKMEESGTLFSQHYLSFVIDEGHLLRNVGPRHLAAVVLGDQSLIRLILSATPIHTKSSDLSSMGRLVGIKHFFTEEAHENEKDDIQNIRRAKKAMEMTDDPLTSDDEEPSNLVAEEQTTAVRRMQRLFKDRIIRRSRDSKTPTGEPLVTLPPHKEIMGILTLTEREMTIINVLAEIAEERTATANSMGKVPSGAFYISYRMAFSFAKANPDDEIPTFKSLEDWEPLKSTKMDTCARLLRHLLSRDDAPPVEFVDGFPVFSSLPILLPGQVATWNCRVLQLYGVECLHIDGNMTFDQRDKTIARFHRVNEPRVLCLSSIGAQGLNLTIADNIILYDQPWSGQEEQQILGRAHRQPQKKTVTMYRLLAGQTVDVALSAMAGVKREMLQTLWQGEHSETLRVLSGGAITASEENIQALEDSPVADDGSVISPKKKKKKKKKVKQVEGDVEDDKEQKKGEAAEGAGVEKPTKRKQKQKRGERAAQEEGDAGKEGAASKTNLNNDTNSKVGSVSSNTAVEVLPAPEGGSSVKVAKAANVTRTVEKRVASSSVPGIVPRDNHHQAGFSDDSMSSLNNHGRSAGTLDPKARSLENFSDGISDFNNDLPPSDDDRSPIENFQDLPTATDNDEDQMGLPSDPSTPGSMDDHRGASPLTGDIEDSPLAKKQKTTWYLQQQQPSVARPKGSMEGMLPRRPPQIRYGTNTLGPVLSSTSHPLPEKRHGSDHFGKSSSLSSASTSQQPRVNHHGSERHGQSSSTSQQPWVNREGNRYNLDRHGKSSSLQYNLNPPVTPPQIRTTGSINGRAYSQGSRVGDRDESDLSPPHKNNWGKRPRK